jgi:hypothetical protein
MPSNTEKFRWVKWLHGERSTKVVYVLQVHSGATYKATKLHAEWFPRLNKWRAIQRVGKHDRKGVLVIRPKYLAEFPCDPELRDFKLAEVMVFLEATYELSQDHTRVAAPPSGAQL